MTRADFNAQWNAGCEPGDIVRHVAFDEDCPACLLHVAHIWQEHDRLIARRNPTVSKPTRKRGKRK